MTARFRDPKGKDYLKAVVIIVTFVVVLTASCIALTFSLGTTGFLIWIAVVVPVLLGALILWHSRSTAYRCHACGHEFTIGVWRDLITPHMFNKFRLRCPRCHKVGWMSVLVSER